MIKHRLWAAALLALLFGRGIGRAQLVMGQYEDEAPGRTWNTFGIPSSASVALGGTEFALALDATAALANPGLAVRLPNLCLTLRGSFTSAEFFRYAVVNTGPVTSNGNFSLNLWTLDSAAATFRLGSWGFGLGYGLAESYNRPAIDIASDSSYDFRFNQTGTLKVFNISVSRSIGPRLALGVGLNILGGSLSKAAVDDFDGGAETITTSLSQTYSGYFINGGLIFDLTSWLRLAAVVRAPFTKKAASHSDISRVIQVGQDFSIQADSDDEYHEPFAAGLGLCCNITPDWLAACDLTYFNWAAYRATLFGETLKRDFRDTLRISLGTQYTASATLFGRDLDLPIRGGVQFDPQPMKAPLSSYFYYSFGVGIHDKLFFLDLSMTNGHETGSGRSLEDKVVALSFGITI
jgi:hypothetical protein